ncbi:MAG: hypothetical protein VKJ64_18210 [Leptolyngbyaceae bacterium]|nr:hypothetical protein [Leptolyngbyaceae bacterium]
MPVLLSEFCCNNHYTVVFAENDTIVLVNKAGESMLFVPTPAYRFPMFYVPLGGQLRGYSLMQRMVA